MQIIFDNKGQAIAWLEEAISLSVKRVDSLISSAEMLNVRWNESSIVTKIIFSLRAPFTKEGSVKQTMKNILAEVEFYRSIVEEAQKKIKIIQGTPEGVLISMDV